MAAAVIEIILTTVKTSETMKKNKTKQNRYMSAVKMLSKSLRNPKQLQQKIRLLPVDD